MSQLWPGWRASRARRQLPWATLCSVVLPWLAGEWIKTFHQPGLDDHSERNRLLVDYIVAGSIVFSLTMVLTFAIGCWITAVLRGPLREGDRFPAGQGRPHTDD